MAPPEVGLVLAKEYEQHVRGDLPSSRLISAPRKPEYQQRLEREIPKEESDAVHRLGATYFICNTLGQKYQGIKQRSNI